MRLPRWGIAASTMCLLASCAPGPRAQVLLFVDTDAPVPSLVDSLMVDVLTTDGALIERRNIVVPDAKDWPVSLGIVRDDVVVRLRAYRADRLARPEIGFGTVEDEPVATFTIDRLVRVPLPVEGVLRASVVLRGRCLAIPASLAGTTSCHAEGTTSRSDTPADDGIAIVEDTPVSQVGTWDEAVGTPCVGEPRAESGLFDEEACVPGGFYFLGDERLRDNACEPACRGFPEIPVRLSPFFVDRHEVTVARWRAALANGFTPARGSWSTSAVFDLCNYGTTRADLDEAQREALPMNCVTWQAARAFCEFDGRSLVTEAQWEFAASGRGEERLYAWGEASPSCDRAAYARLGASGGAFAYGAATECAQADPNDPLRAVFGQGPRPVGSSGDLSRDGISDLAGNLLEWVIDEGGIYGESCWTLPLPRDPVCAGGLAMSHPLRGGSWAGGSGRLAVSWRDVRPESHITADVGFRCSRPGGP